LRPRNNPRQQIHLVALELTKNAAVSVNSPAAAVAVRAKRHSKPVLRALCHPLTFANVVDLDGRIFFADAKQRATGAA